MSIEWQKDAVCSADGRQWFVNYSGDDKRYQLQNFSGDRFYSFYGIINFAKHFQLNTIKQSDCISKSELDTEDRYNQAVEVFRLLGLELYKDHEGYNSMVQWWEGLEIYEGEIVSSNTIDGRRITFNQLMAIGELKRMMNERDKSDNTVDKGISTEEELRIARERFNETGTIDGNLLREHTLVWLDDLLPKDDKVVLDGVEVDVKGNCNKRLNTSKTPDSSYNWPQVGDEVEFKPNPSTDQWVKATIKYKGDKFTILKSDNDREFSKRNSKLITRKPKTPEEVAREKIEKRLKEIIFSNTTPSSVAMILEEFNITEKEA